MNTLRFHSRFFQQDPRHFQLVYLGSFLLLGMLWLDWYPTPLHYFTLIGTCLLTQALGNTWIGRPWHDLKSAAITSLGLCLLCHGQSVGALALAGVLAIGSKFLIRVQGKHIFNPANFGIVMSILLTGQTWVSPGQWGETPMLVLLFSAAGLMILFHVGRLDVGLTFLMIFGGLLLGKDVWYKGWPLDFWLHSLANGSLLLFSFFMITDPVSTPSAKRGRYFWAICIAVLSFVMASWWQVYAAPIYALFICSPLTALVDRWWPAQQFQWQMLKGREGDRNLSHAH